MTKSHAKLQNSSNKGNFHSPKLSTNLDFQHLSGKMGQNLTDDYGSRNPVVCPGEQHCKVCSFASECASLTTNNSISFNQNIIASIENMVNHDSNQLVNDIIRGVSKINISKTKTRTSCNCMSDESSLLVKDLKIKTQKLTPLRDIYSVMPT